MISTDHFVGTAEDKEAAISDNTLRRGPLNDSFPNEDAQQKKHECKFSKGQDLQLGFSDPIDRDAKSYQDESQSKANDREGLKLLGVGHESLD